MKVKRKIAQLTSGFFAVSCLALVIFSCTGKKKPGHEAGLNAKMLIVSHAKKFRIELGDGYSQVSVLDPWQGATECGAELVSCPKGEKTSCRN